VIFAVLCPLPGRVLQLRPAQPVIRAPADMAARATRARAQGRLRVGAAVDVAYKTKRGGAPAMISVAPVRADAVEEDDALVLVELRGDPELKLCVVRPARAGAEPRFRVGARTGR